MRTQGIAWPGKVMPAIMTFIVLLLLAWQICNGQVPVEQKIKTSNPVPDSIVPVNKPMGHIVVLDDLARGGGYAFMNAQEKEVAFLSEREIYSRSPYLNIHLGAARQDGIPGNYQSFDVTALSVEAIKKGLPKTLKRMPADIKLQHVGVVTSRLAGVDYDREHPLYLVVSYALEIYDRESLTQKWVETTIHVYNLQGKLISTIVDNHNIQGTYISSDGKYILANEILARIGDGVSEVYTGLVLYDVGKNKLIGKIGNQKGTYYTDVKMSAYENRYFLLYSSLFKDIFKSSDFVSLILIIDPDKRILYSKINRNAQQLDGLRLKSHLYPDGEDISTYEVLNF